jgi:cell division transport system ATP-binding protein
MMIQAFHLTKVHPSGAKVLDDAFFSAPEGSFTAILGESRTGKSTFLKMLAGEEKPTAGTLRIDHLDPYALSESERNRWLASVGMIFPDLELFPDKTVEENILFILKVKGAPPEGQREAVAKLLGKAGLGDRADVKPSSLSSGEQRMVLALRALIFRPRLLLADGPFEGLDEKAFGVLFKFLLDLHRSGTTVVLAARHASFQEEAGRIAPGAPIHWIRMEQGKFTPLEAVP